MFEVHTHFKAVSFLLLVTCLFVASSLSISVRETQAQSLRYEDEAGNIYWVDRLDEVPSRYRSQIVPAPTPISDKKILKQLEKKAKKVKAAKKKKIKKKHNEKIPKAPAVKMPAVSQEPPSAEAALNGPVALGQPGPAVPGAGVLPPEAGIIVVPNPGISNEVGEAINKP